MYRSIRIFYLSAVFAGLAASHSWVEEVDVIKDGNYSGQHGFCRGYVARSADVDVNTVMPHLLPPSDSGRLWIDQSDPVCSQSQVLMNYTQEYPQLHADPGDYIAIRYLENGHVSLPQNQLGKPEKAGTVHVFGTGQPRSDHKLVEVMDWTTDGTGGNREGVLLARQTFDDGRCYQLNDGVIAAERKAAFPDLDDDGVLHEQWCENNVRLPEDVHDIYTIYWIWDWPTRPGTPGVPSGKDEIYTSCLDIRIGPSSESSPHPLSQQDPQKHATSDYIRRASDLVNI